MRRSILDEQSPATELELERPFDHWVASLLRTTRASVAAAVMLDEQQLVVVSRRTPEGPAPAGARLALTESLAEHLAGRVDALYAEAPITVDGRHAGWLAMSGQFADGWADRELEALQDAARALCCELELEDARRAESRDRGLVASHNRLHDLIGRDAPLPAILTELVQGIERYEPSVIPAVVYLDPETRTLHPGAAPSLPEHYFSAIDGVVIGPNIGTCGSAAWSGQLTITEDIAEDPKWAPVRDFAVGCGLRHCWSMPIKGAAGDVLGTFALYGPEPRRPLPEHIALMEDGARLAGIAIERRRATERLVRDARTDGLTGLPNRRAIFEHLDDALARTDGPARTAVLFIDLDGLKGLNDSLGHDRADEVLREVGKRLASVLRTGDVVGRFGGDEFVAIAEGIVDEAQAAELGQRLLDVVSRPLIGLGGRTMTASVGVAILDAGTDAAEAVRRADHAMYEAKRTGRDRCAFFAGADDLRGGRRSSLALALRDAELRGETRLVFDPIIDLERETVVGFAALPRWTSPVFGEVAPAEFIEVAEKSGAIKAIGAWALREACETIAALSASSARPLELAIAVSIHQLRVPGVAQTVHQTLAHARHPAELTTLRVSEAALASDDPQVVRALSELTAVGVAVGLDEFGSTHCSLAEAGRGTVNEITIGRKLVRRLPGDPISAALVRAAIDVAAAAGCSVTAEADGSPAELQALRALGCARAQGAGAAGLEEPLPAAELTSLPLSGHVCVRQLPVPPAGQPAVTSASSSV